MKYFSLVLIPFLLSNILGKLLIDLNTIWSSISFFCHFMLSFCRQMCIPKSLHSYLLIFFPFLMFPLISLFLSACKLFLISYFWIYSPNFQPKSWSIKRKRRIFAFVLPNLLWILETCLTSFEGRCQQGHTMRAYIWVVNENHWKKSKLHFEYIKHILFYFWIKPSKLVLSWRFLLSSSFIVWRA